MNNSQLTPEAREALRIRTEEARQCLARQQMRAVTNQDSENGFAPGTHRFVSKDGTDITVVFEKTENNDVLCTVTGHLAPPFGNENKGYLGSVRFHTSGVPLKEYLAMDVLPRVSETLQYWYLSPDEQNAISSDADMADVFAQFRKFYLRMFPHGNSVPADELIWLSAFLNQLV